MRKMLFAEEYLASKTLNASEAARKIGYAESRARKEGSRLLADPDVQAEIARLMAERSERTQITADEVLCHWRDIATADPNELVEYRRTCCRYCYGKDFKYQRTPQEMEDDRAEWAAESKRHRPVEFPVEGGLGYDARKPPRPDCIECFGEGEGQAFFKDTRTLSTPARRLYGGVKITKGGIEVIMHNPMEALVNVAKHLGMFIEKVEHTGAGGAPLTVSVTHIIVDPSAG